VDLGLYASGGQGWVSSDGAGAHRQPRRGLVEGSSERSTSPVHVSLEIPSKFSVRDKIALIDHARQGYTDNCRWGGAPDQTQTHALPARLVAIRGEGEHAVNNLLTKLRK